MECTVRNIKVSYEIYGEKDAQFQVFEEDVLLLNKLSEEERGLFHAEGIM
ncbi:hypothetical protein J2Z32_000671 [Paenibacillus turicensis]|uniref:Uncharacterized protein n=1 Tax=Paenibacillus turicensis TaxID=160487 RepID=A0ABS4FN97_9BACL|nr:hypothetical protein [Paenibacillus turicensis]MBP1904054.1 hypothetical protein [Paenibacillus turicensis]